MVINYKLRGARDNLNKLPLKRERFCVGVSERERGMCKVCECERERECLNVKRNHQSPKWSAT